MTYDSRADTLFHSQRVGELMIAMVKEMLDRSHCHDRSKTQSPEVEIFDEYTPKLMGMTYGSDEYEQARAAMGPALTHHYMENRHHPEWHRNGVNDMTLVDLVEMLADWRAATERHSDGALGRSLAINRERFGMSEQLTRILENTAVHFGWIQERVLPPLDAPVHEGVASV